jgi:hypothetical protein
LAIVSGKLFAQAGSPEKAAERAIDAVMDLEFPTAASLPSLEDAFNVAAAFDPTVYVWLLSPFIQRGSLLLTADERPAFPFAGSEQSSPSERSAPLYPNDSLKRAA